MTACKYRYAMFEKEEKIRRFYYPSTLPPFPPLLAGGLGIPSVPAIGLAEWKPFSSAGWGQRWHLVALPDLPRYPLASFGSSYLTLDLSFCQLNPLPRSAPGLTTGSWARRL